MWLDSLPVHLVLVSLVSIGGVQDWRTRRVSNWLTIPLFTAGIVNTAIRIFVEPETGVALLIVLSMLTWVARLGWMGGADYKVVVGLFGVWPQGGFAALIGAGLWGLVVLIRTRDRSVTFPGVTAMAIAVALTILWEASIMLPT